MRKLLRPRDYLLLTFGLLGDTFEEIKDPLHLQEQGCRYLYGWVPDRWKKHHFEKAVWRMFKTGDIERIVSNGQAAIRLTSSGKEKWTREFPLATLSQRPWDGRWRIVSFDIPEKLKGRRESLRNKIERFGMGQLQESLYITPFDFGSDLREFIESHGLSDYVVVFEARNTFGEEARSLAWRVWRLEQLEEKYHDLLQLVYQKDLRDKDEKSDLQTKYEEVLLDDPLLPKELLPDDWIGFKVRKLILNNSLYSTSV